MEIGNPITSPRVMSPAISVIIPMYNAEKYVAECLESILAQTFQNFEVIVVDDCSTDNSVAIVESYSEKFGGRLKFTKMKKKSGGGGIPRNKGVSISRGEYIFFLDADDTITPTAFGELYPIAKNFDADVVHCEKYYQIPDKIWYNSKARKKIKPFSYKKGKFITEPLLITNNISERVELLSEVILIWNAGGKFLRRDFINENELKFCNVVHEDLLFTMCTICSAKNYVVVPNVFYNYRRHENSVISAHLDLPQLLHRQITSLKIGINYLDDFFGDYKIFSLHPELKYILFDMFTRELFARLFVIYEQIPAPDLDKFLIEEFDGENIALKAFCFSSIVVQRLQIFQMQSQFNEFAAQAQKRITELENEVRRIR